MGKDFNYHRRLTRSVRVGNIEIGSGFPVRIQTMGSRSTMDTEGCVEQGCRMARAGAELIRYTAQGIREAENLGLIREKLRGRGVFVPLVADIHFNPRAAFAAAVNVEKVRINPGNFVDPGRTFRKIEYTDEEYARELAKIKSKLVPFVELCREHGTAIRIGVNHGSLSDRIMSRYGDTPRGMTESALEFLRVCRDTDFHNVVVSIKASNVRVMVATVRMLAHAMDAEGLNYPLHLGVTEAGDGLDGRVKSAVGIGTLLAEGLGDTIRVSLSEEPECELPVARELADYISARASAPLISGTPLAEPRCQPNAIVVSRVDAPSAATPPDVVVSHGIPDDMLIVSTDNPNVSGSLGAMIAGKVRGGFSGRVIASVKYDGVAPETVALRASADLGPLLIDGYIDGIMVESDSMTPSQLVDLSFAILQATRSRVTKTEYIACPSCGRTLFDLQDTLHRVKEATKGLKGLKIGVMGCIVNGPGEMADADYGYVGAGVGCVSLYRGRECVEKGIPQQEAVARLVKLIKDDGRWT